MIYPAVLLFLMAGVLAVLVARVLPVFTGVYTGLAGSVSGFFLCVHHGCKYHRLGISVPGHRVDGAFAYRCGCGAHAAWERPVPHVVLKNCPLLLLLPGGWRRRNLLRRWPRLRPAGWTPTQQWNARRTWCGTARCAHAAWKAAAGRCLRGAAWRRPFTITVCSNRCTRAC